MRIPEESGIKTHEKEESKMIKYGKLVRDKIPEVIEASGKKCDYNKAGKEELLELLISKLDEEVAEFKEERNLEELADIMEVLFGLASDLGFSEQELLRKRDVKKEERGGFKEGIVLTSVY